MLNPAYIFFVFLFASFIYGESEKLIFYSDRPSPLTVDARPHTNTSTGTAQTPVLGQIQGISYENIRRAHLEAAAQLTFYTNWHNPQQPVRIVGVGRGPEYIMDMLELMGNDEQRSRMIRVNVSRRIANPSFPADGGPDPNLRAYLEQQGITLERLQQGEVFVLADLGWYGNLHQRIIEQFPGYENRFRTHYFGIAYRPAAETTPVSRVFHTALEPDAQTASPHRNRNLVMAYDQIWRTFPWALRLQRRNGTSGPIDAVANLNEPARNATEIRERYPYQPDLARAIMEDQRWWSQQAEARELWGQRMTLMGQLQSLLRLGDPEAAHRGLERILSNPANTHNPYVHAHVYDFLDIVNKNYRNQVTLTYNPQRLRVGPQQDRRERAALPREIHPREIAARAGGHNAELLRHIRFSRGDIVYAESMSQTDNLRIRKSSIDQLIDRYLENGDARHAIEDALTSRHPDLVIHTARRLMEHPIRDSHRNILLAAANALTLPVNLGDRVVGEALSQLLSAHQHQAERLIPDELLSTLLGLEEMAGRDLSQFPRRDTNQMTPVDRQRYLTELRNHAASQVETESARQSLEILGWARPCSNALVNMGSR